MKLLPTLPSPRTRRRQTLKWVCIGLMFLLIIIAVILTGFFFFISDKKAQQKHSLSSDSKIAGPFNENNDPLSPVVAVALTLTNFDPDGQSLSFNLQAAVFTDNDTTPYLCAQIGDPNSVNIIPVYPLSFNAPGASSSVTTANNNVTTNNITMDGFVSRYPLDTYTGVLTILIYQPANISVSCDDLNFDPTVDTIIPSEFIFGQGLQGFSSHNDGTNTSIPDEQSLGAGSVRLSFTVKRATVIQFFAVIMFIATWLLTLGVLLAIAQVIFDNKQARFDLVAAGTALLFALPSLRSAQPGIPTTPTVYDTVGYFWNVALLAIGTFALICHGIYHLQVDPVDDGSVDGDEKVKHA